MENNTLDWVAVNRQPSRRTLFPIQSWMNDRQMANGQWSAPHKSFTRKCRAHVCSIMNSTQTPDFFITPAKFTGTPSGFRVTLDENDFSLYRDVVFPEWAVHYNCPSFIVPTQGIAKRIIYDFTRQYAELHGYIADAIDIC